MQVHVSEEVFLLRAPVRDDVCFMTSTMGGEPVLYVFHCSSRTCCAERLMTTNKGWLEIAWISS
jgi:hypothetical protein